MSQPVIHANEEVRARSTELPALATALDWAEKYLSAPHPDLGRPGVVCPYVRSALRHNTLWFTEVPAATENAARLDARLTELAAVFTGLDPVEPERATEKALIIAFPGLPAEQAPDLLGGMLRRLKPAFVDDGLMLGPVFPGNEIPGAHNPDFRPMRGPVPLVALRVLMETDLPFLDRPIDPPHLRARYLRAYLTRLGTRISLSRKEKAERTLAALEAEAQLR
ncbi:DUF6875 domain-containing protein [Amycolatopsis sp. YIM 10]|uniref:DUF6875 domain-containing protein n=1 Tax=Amycolatopsis sp. YIM 10 TaxID=2653857 RepID=UPI001290633C|nr:hypothetical protein [Amycolatopsis sp. YIM 10]QFU89906.1 hypothetical protein YIM_23645 [Amycolatopsis sp. YIM 10]